MGLIHIYCGDGKGKTTASMGLAVRAAGAGMRVHIVQFLKGSKTAELESLALISNIRVTRPDRNYGFTFSMTDEDKAAISRSLDDLEKNGYITCASGAGKRYKSPLRLTERGKAVGRAIGEKITRIVEAASEGLSEAERQTRYRALALVSENLERIYTHKKTAGDRAARSEK